MRSHKTMNTIRSVFAVIVAACPAVGCSDMNDPLELDPARGSGAMSRHLPGVSTEQAFDAGVHAMRQWFHRLDQRPVEGLVKGMPTEYTQAGGTERIRDSIGFRNRMRRIGTLSIRPRGGGCVVSCRIDRQRLDTADHRVFRQNEERNDLPNRTPLERDAGLNADQEQVWTDMQRDRALERQTLDLVAARATGNPADNSASETESNDSLH